jgi:uncharacterized protein CXXCG
VDLTSFPERSAYEEFRMEPPDEFVRLRELVRPLVPPGFQLPPGTTLGPLVGTATGTFSSLYFYFVEMPLIRREALEQLQAEGIRGLRGVPTELRFRQKTQCGRDSFTFPEDPILDAAHTDLFRLSDFATIFIATERFVDAVRRLELEGVVFRELPLR